MQHPDICMPKQSLSVYDRADCVPELSPGGDKNFIF
jgi:hypothetical protein